MFSRFAKWISNKAGKPTALTLAFLILVIWAAAGPFLHYSTTWHLSINTVTTIVVFLMVFLIQNTQYRTTEAIHVKLDEILTHLGIHDLSIIDAEELSDKDLEDLLESYEHLVPSERQRLKNEIKKLLPQRRKKPKSP